MEITKEKIAYDNRIVTCWHCSLEPKSNTIKAAWKDFMRENFSVKVYGFGFFTNKDVLYAENILIKSVTATDIDLYAHIVEANGNTTISLFGRIHEQDFFNPEAYPSSFGELKRILYLFLREFLPSYYYKDVKEASMEVKELESEINSIRDEIVRNEKKIAKQQKEIATLTIDLSKDKEDLEKAQQTLNAKKNKLNHIESELKDI